MSTERRSRIAGGESNLGRRILGRPVWGSNQVGRGGWTSGVAAAGVVLGLAMGLTTGLTGCRVHVDKDSNGKEKTVQVDTPFGGVHVNTDQTTAADLGLPVYPGAHSILDDDKHKSADVHMGFGDWQLRVKAVMYASSDSREKVAAFYKKALGRYGDVIVCDGDTVVGTPTATHEGLTCQDKGETKGVHIDTQDKFKQGYELKAGSKRHQHIVGFEDNKDSDTRFSLVALDLPAALVDSEDRKE